MSKEKALSSGMFLQDLFQFGLYKRNQGRITRQVTFAGLAVVIALGAYRMSESLANVDWGAGMRYYAPLAFLAIGLWISFRAVNYPKFADFLIAVEAEMNKVSWPSKAELYRSSMVVMFTIFVLAVMLFSFDLIWGQLFGWLDAILEFIGFKAAPAAG